MRTRLTLTCCTLALGLVLAAPARAQTNPPTVKCYDATLRPNVVYITGSTAAKPFLGPLAKLLAKESTPYTIVYQGQGSCVGVSTIYQSDPTKRVIKDVTKNWAIYWDADGVTSHECSLDPAGNTVDVGISDVYAASCGYTAPPEGVTITDYQGPIQPMTVVVPAASKQRSISHEAGYLVFGLGGHKGAAAPWTDPQYYFVRNASSGTQQMVARAVGVPAEKWWGINRGSSTAVLQAMKVLVDETSAEKSLGILATTEADAERANLRILAFQAKGQSCGYWPDSSPTAFDKLNVREGRYAIWGPLHFFARVTGGVPSAAAGAVVSRFAAARIDQDLIDAEIKKYVVPRCAMKVSRSEEMGPLKPYSPDYQCGCYFDLVANGSTKCQTCKGPGDCPSTRPARNYGYCEAK